MSPVRVDASVLDTNISGSLALWNRSWLPQSSLDQVGALLAEDCRPLAAQSGCAWRAETSDADSARLLVRLDSPSAAWPRRFTTYGECDTLRPSSDLDAAGAPAITYHRRLRLARTPTGASRPELPGPNDARTHRDGPQPGGDAHSARDADKAQRVLEPLLAAVAGPDVALTAYTRYGEAAAP